MPAPVAAAAARVAAGAVANPKSGSRIALGGGLGLLALLLLVLAPLAVLNINQAAQQQQGIDPSGVPAAARPFVAMYQDAAKVYGVNPFLLMAVHEDETSFGSSTQPGVRTGVNFAGCCAGPMQFYIAGNATPAQGGAGATWAGYANAYHKAKLARPASYPLRFDKHPNVYDSYDAIYAAALYFKGLGAGRRLDQRTYQALLAYKGTPPASIPYARHDYERAKALEQAASAPASRGPLTLVPGNRVRILPSGLAAAPQDAPASVKGMVRAANEISNKPYLLVHYPTHINNPTYDCSSSSSHVLWGGRRFGRAPWTSGLFMSYGKSGPGRWVSTYAHSGHMFIVIGGARFDTGRYDQGPNAGESGPRWRTGSRPMGGFVVRHPEGL